MSNPHRGETSIEIGGTTYTLALTTNALCEVEEATGKGIGDLMQQMARVSTVRALFWAALRRDHPDMTIPGAGDLMHEAGIAAVMTAVQQALAVSFPAADKDAGENPQKRKRA